ncbi:hypothetical protein D6850_02965 [Roseovarius spongiae]|uniref:Uncharacterized protein n=1 Tax=Roseovarius spongiae TaxID=2320272 RepID=A0A3A8AXG6_9RHOB|nr:hypothetical protein [Roseovarius spongiae]RKF16527.1 hypothetical protein D6850_02965 [Roseovarius spongiae]
MRAAPVLFLALMLSACTQFPQLDGTVSEEVRRAPYPDLVPLGTLDMRATTGRLTPETGARIEARIARLRARAARLRGTVIDAPARRRMKAGVDS